VGLSAIDLQKGNIDQAEENLSLLLYGQQVEPGVSEEAYHVLGDAYYMNRKYKEAVDAYAMPLASTAMSMRAALSLYRSGESFGKIGYYYNGIQVLRRLMAMSAQMQPQTDELKALGSQAQLLIGDFYFASGSYQAAVAAYRGVAESSPLQQQRGWALLRMGDALARTGDEQGAAKALEEAVSAVQFNFLGRFAQARLDDMKWKKNMQNDLENYL
jgi:outer membrane protein assembly factor BamD (BamD/ComL family)